MTGGSSKPSTNNKPPPPSSSSRRSRWESSVTTSTTANNAAPTTSAPKSSAAPGGGGSFAGTKPSPNPNPDKTVSKSTPNPNPNPSEQKKTQSDRSAAATAQSSGHPFPGLDSGPPRAPFTPPPSSYGFHMLDRRSIVLADGSVRSYLALPPDYQDFTPPVLRSGSSAQFFRPGHSEMMAHGRFLPMGPMSPDAFRGRDDQFGRNRNTQDYWNSMGLDDHGGVEGSTKRKYAEEEGRERDGKDELARRRQQLLQYANAGLGERRSFFSATRSSPVRGDDEMRSLKYPRTSGAFDNNVALKHEVDPLALKKSFLNYAKVINENPNQKKNYLENGKYGPIQCIACGRSSKDFPDVHDLIMHTYSSHNADQLVDHLGLHKALCVLMGWNYFKPPDNSRAYQFLPVEQAAVYQDDLIMWPPTVIIHNTSTGKGKDGHMEGLGNKAVDSKIRELGFGGGKSKSLYGRDGHLGITLVKFSSDPTGLREAMRLADHFEKENHGRNVWGQMQSVLSGKDDENNPNLVKVDGKTGVKQRIFYGYLATASDLDKVDFETKKKVVLESKQEYLQSK
ncbi:hypothetical protein Dimus_029082 [Dionaea muscipula]